MIDFQRIDGPFGVPIYFQRLSVNTVSLYWIVFVGSADDKTVGEEGIYHWFEHIPSRGTRKYPGGYRDTEARLIRHGGDAGAETGYTYTAFYADVPKRVWPETLDVLTDMIAQPLLRTEDIEAEGKVIRQEIDEWHSSPYSESLCRLPSILWPGHPLGHDQLGSHASIDSIDPSLLRKAHQLGYARSRCVLFVAGDIDPHDLVAEVASSLERMSDQDIAERRQSARYGSLPPWQSGEQTVVESDFDDSIVYLLFPVPPLSESENQFLDWIMLDELITAGELGSPLNQVIREHAQLAYSPEFISSLNPDGGYCGLVAQTSCKNPQRVVDAFWDVLRNAELASPQWHNYVRDTIRGEIEMHDPDAGDYTETGSHRLILHGEPCSDHNYARRLLSFSQSDVNNLIESLTPSRSHAIIFQGRCSM